MIKGRVHKFGANIDTDGIIPAKYANLSDPVELGRHCLENVDPGFADRIRPGDIIMATTNFGCGSSREIAPWSIKGAGAACVVAQSFARIFFRNAINIGLPVLECPEVVVNTEPGQLLEVDLSCGVLKNLDTGQSFQAAPYPDFVQELIAAGGLVEYIKRKLSP